MVTEMWNDIVTETQGAKRLAQIVARNGAGNGARNGNRNGDQNQFTLILLCICVGSAIQGRRSRSSQQVTAGPLVAIVWPTARVPPAPPPCPLPRSYLMVSSWAAL